MKNKHIFPLHVFSFDDSFGEEDFKTLKTYEEFMEFVLGVVTPEDIMEQILDDVPYAKVDDLIRYATEYVLTVLQDDWAIYKYYEGDMVAMSDMDLESYIEGSSELNSIVVSTIDVHHEISKLEDEEEEEEDYD